MYEIPGKQVSVSLQAAQETKYRFVKLTADGAALATAATDVVLGVLQRAGRAGECVPVMVDGISMVEASAAIAKAALVGPTTAGKAVTVASGAYSGIALEAAPAAGDIIPVLVRPNATKASA